MPCLHTEEAKIGPQVQERDFLGYYKESLANLVYLPEISIELKYRIVKFSTKRVGKQQVQTEHL